MFKTLAATRQQLIQDYAHAKEVRALLPNMRTLTLRPYDVRNIRIITSAEVDAMIANHDRANATAN